MANENETVEQVCDYLANNDNSTGEPIGVAMPSLANRILAAHNREIAAKDAEFDRCKLERIRCREELHATRERRDDCEAKMHKALERVTRAENALAARDAEILSLKAKIDEYERQPELMADVATKALELLKRQDAEIASFRSLVRELTDALDESNKTECEHYCKCSCSKGDKNNGCETMCKNRALVAKAREVCHA